jgi:hypothetical protein
VGVSRCWGGDLVESSVFLSNVLTDMFNGESVWK